MEDISWLAVKDGLTSVVWMIDNSLLVLASARAAERLLPEERGAARVLTVTVIACAILTAVLVLLGTLNVLSGPAMLIGVGSVSLGILTRLKKTPPIDSHHPKRQVGLQDQVCAIFWLMLLGLLCGHSVVDGLLKLPTDFDCLMYHLPLVDSCLQAGSLYAPDCSHWSSPAGSELLALWCCGPFSGDFLSPLNNLPIVIVWASATLQLGRLLGMTERWPELTTVAVLSTYTLLHETDDASNDLMVVAFFMAANVYVVRCLQARETRLLFMTGVCLGLLAGVKFFAVGYAAVTWFTLVAGLSISAPWRFVLRAAISTTVIGVVVGGYWYLRNFVVTGLPLYPMGDSASLAYPNVWSTSLIGNADPRLWPLFFDAVWQACGPVHWAAALLLPSTVCAMIWGAFASRHAESRSAPGWGAAVIFLTGSAAVLWITPYLVEDQPGTLNHLQWAYTPARYGASFLTMTVVCLALVLHRVTSHSSQLVGRLTFGCLVLCVIWQIVLRLQSHSREFSHMEAGIAGINLGFIFLVIRQGLYSSTSRSLQIVTACATLGLVAVGTGVLAQRWHSEYDSHFDRHFRTSAFTTLHQATSPTSPVLVLDYRPYPFYRSRRQQHVINPRRYQSEDWLQQLIAERNPQIITCLADQGYQVDRYHGAVELLATHRDRFPPIVPSGSMIVTRTTADEGEFPSAPAMQGEKTQSH